ncbi:lysylphosphatidylglycerol synthase transmembrane domain-containing protein [Magnetofaba australis]|uniref:Uncharacterized protein n=1 Tax=Magnetofaba australis IT-1 TaxID=1434232 RepID=A0A1Y2K8T7_9PROT|nr:lysylphosphatidylglycerol synthase transmembrane domain-containing protein [Magnetofaba australis]OSM06866.1 hypothetical protein MAIT1_00258 [Magnetofaba australis IT-1]
MKNLLILLAKIGLALGGLAFGYRLLVERGVDQTIARGGDLALLALALAIIPALILALRFQLVLRMWELRISLKDAVRIHLQSLFYMFFMPVSVGMEVSRFAKTRHLLPEGSGTALATALVFDRILGLVFYILIAMALFPFVTLQRELTLFGVTLDLSTGIAWAAPGVVVAMLVVIWVAWRRGLFDKLREMAPRMAPALRDHLGTLAWATLASLAGTMGLMCMLYLAALGFGVPVTFLDLAFIFTGGSLFAIIPITVVGVTAAEMGSMALYLLMGVPEAQAALMVGMGYAVRLLYALYGGVAELAHGGWGLFKAHLEGRKDVEP